MLSSPTRKLVVVADLVGSRRLTPLDRRAVQAFIREILGPRGAFRYSGGDEFEWALPDLPESLDELVRFRLRLGAALEGLPPVRFRVGIGRGEVTVEDATGGPYAEDGPAYHRARAAIDRLKAKPSRRRRTHDRPLDPVGATRRATAIDDGRWLPSRDALLLLMDKLAGGWTLPQWEVAHLSAEGQTYAQIGERLGISEQAVHKRLSAAQLDIYLEGHAALKADWVVA
ncbi:MAG: hypothetical protein H6732_16860 [Alphaproteobacteria bacterium]|nr:hypothetical protein [Alphaproteobacteria bacterium]